MNEWTAAMCWLVLISSYKWEERPIWKPGVTYGLPKTISQPPSRKWSVWASVSSTYFGVLNLKNNKLRAALWYGVSKFIVQRVTLRMQHNNFLGVDFASLFRFHSPAVKTAQKGEIDCRELLWGHAPLVFWFSRYFLFGEWTSAWSCHCLLWPTHSLLLQGDKL